MEKKIKGLLPSLKEKKRYLAFEIIDLNEQHPSIKQVMPELTKKMKNFLGMINSARAGIMAVDYAGNKGIIRLNNASSDNVKSSFIFISELNSRKVIIRSLGISGMINKARKYL